MNTTTQGHQRQPDVAVLSNGDVVVVWGGPTSPGFGAFAQRFAPDGAPEGREIAIGASGSRVLPQTVVAALDSDNYAIAFESSDRPTMAGPISTAMQRMRPRGAFWGDQLRMQRVLAGAQRMPAIAGLRRMGLVTAWRAPDGRREGVWIQIIGRNGAPIGTPEIANQSLAGNQREPTVARLGSGRNFVVAWTAPGSGANDGANIIVRRFMGPYRDYAIVQDVGLEVDIRWSALEQAPYVSRLAIEMDGEPLAAIVSPPAEGRAQLTDFNFAHPLLRRAVLPDDMPEDGDEDFATGSPLEDEIWSLAREAAADRSTPDTPDDQPRIAVGTELGALPRLDRDLILDIRDPEVKKAELEERTPRVNGLRALLSEMILGPARLVRNHLMQMTYIGPLRDIPTRSYRPQVTPDEARWAQGLAAWDLLYNDRRGELMAEVNWWLSGEERLRTT